MMDVPFSRRMLLQHTSLGLGSAILSLLNESPAVEKQTNYGDQQSRPTHFPAKAKAVIQLVQNGGPSQMDLFDPKPELKRLAGKPHPDGVEIHQPNNANALLPTPFTFKKHGESGMDISSALPELSKIVDECCFVRSMHTEHNNHLEGLNMLLTCKIFPGRPVMGSWISYALGTENQNLPSYVVLRDPAGYTVGGKQLWANAYLPALFQGVEFSTKGAPVHHLKPQHRSSPSVSAASLNFLNQLNRRHQVGHEQETELEARIKNYELAARMQLEAPRALDISKESKATRTMYGLDDAPTRAYGTRCLMARRLVEAGVRFVQVTTSPGQPWDQHSNLKTGLNKIAKATDRGAAALIQDLKQRGLLDSTIVMWSGEFGRLPTSQNGQGRDHNRNAFTMFFAGGGFKPGLIYGATDEFGYRSVENRVSVPDMVATVMHQLGLNHRQVRYQRGGRFETPSDVTVSGAKVVNNLVNTTIHCS